MKYMNNHYGQSRIFGKARFNAPDMGDGANDGADISGAGGAGADDSGADDSGDDGSEPTIDELQAQLAKAKADYQKLKVQSDKAAKEAKQYKDQARARMNADEQAQQAQAEKDAQFEEMKRELRINKYSKRLVGIGMDETQADEMASILPEIEDHDAFFDALGKFIESVKKSSGDAAVQKLLKDRPEINAGGGDSDKDDPAMALAKSFVDSHKGQGNAGADIIKNYF